MQRCAATRAGGYSLAEISSSQTAGKVTAMIGFELNEHISCLYGVPHLDPNAGHAAGRAELSALLGQSTP